MPKRKHRLTASKLDLAMKCGYAFRRDKANDWPHDEAGRPAQVGRAFHRLAEHCIQGSTVDPQVRLERERFPHDVIADALVLFEAAEPHLQGLPKGTRVEVKFALNPETGAAYELVSPKERDYREASSDEAVGTVDALYAGSDLSGIKVVDFQTGQSNYKGDAEGNAQLAFGLLAVAAAHRKPAQGNVAIWWARPDGVKEDWHHIDEAEAARWRRAFAELLAQSKRNDAEPTPGPHCWQKFCPLRTVCPEAERMAQELEPVKRRLPMLGEAVAAIREKRATKPQVAEAIQASRLAREYLKGLDDAIKGYVATEGGIPLGGKVYDRRTVRRESIDLSAPGALEALGNLDTLDLDSIAPRKMTKQALTRQLGPRAAEDVVELLRGCGAVRQSERDEWRER